MKFIFPFFWLFILGSCTIKEEEDFSYLERDLEHFELGFELDEPNSILNNLAKGNLDRNIKAVLRQHHDEFPEPAEKYWEFHYLPNSDRVSEMVFYSGNYRRCEQTNFNFFYNRENLLDSIVSNRINVCNEFEVNRLYTFNYTGEGLLKSIFMDNETSVEENYFSYYPNGRIKEIFNDFHHKGDWEPGFGVQKFYYDKSFSNVIKHEKVGLNSHYTYYYFYDDKPNPFKGLFIAASVFMPNIGPAYLSENNVIKMIEKNENNIHGNSFSYEFDFNFVGDRLDTYADKNEDKMPYIFYRVNP